MRNKLLLGFALTVALICCPRGAWPTVSNTNVETVTGPGDGVTVNFTPTFDFRDNSWLTVALVDSSGATTQIPQGGCAGCFHVTGGNPGTTIVMGTAPSSSQHLVISRAVPLIQPVVFNPASIFPYKGVSAELDQMTLALQNINVFGGPSTVSGGGGSGFTPSSGGLPNPSAPYDFIAWNSLGTSVVNATVAYDAGQTTFQVGDMLQFNGSGWATKSFTQSGLMSLLNSSPNDPLSAASGGSGVTNPGTFAWGSNPITFTTSGVTSLTLPTSGTLLTGTATNNNVANTIVKRDGSGNFSAGTVTANVIGNLTGNVTGNLTGNASGTASNVTGVVAIGNGGTGQTTQQNAINTLLDAGSAGSTVKFARFDGTNVSLSPLLVQDVPQGFSRLKLAQDTPNTLITNDAFGNMSVLPGITAGNCAGFDGVRWLSVPCGIAGSLVGVTYYGTDTGTPNHYIVTTPTSPGIYIPGVIVSFVTTTTNTGPSDLDLDTLGPVALMKDVNGVPTALAANDILTGTLINATYDGTEFILTNSLAQLSNYALNLNGGSGGSLPYQSAANVTAMLANGLAGQALLSQGGTAAPVWGDSVIKAGTLAGGLGGSLPYQSSTDVTAMLPNGAVNQVLTSQGGTSAPVWGNSVLNATNATSAASAVHATNATNLDGGLGGSLPYQSAADTTAMLANGSLNQVLTSSGGTGAPSWGDSVLNATNATNAVNATTAALATNLAGGMGGEIAYQVTTDVTALLANGSAGSVLQSNGGTLAPSWVAMSGGSTLATNLAGGLGGSIPYQSAVDTTAMLDNGLAGSVLVSQGTTLPPKWAPPSAAGGGTAPTVQKFTSGSGTYTTPTSPVPLYIQIIAVGGGGGGSRVTVAGCFDGCPNASDGASTFFGPHIAFGGIGAIVNGPGGGTGGAGGPATIGAGGMGTAVTGGSGTAGAVALSGVSGTDLASGPGGSNPLGGAGGGTVITTGINGAPNTGAGGSGGSYSSQGSASYEDHGSGGGAGGYLNILVPSPAGSYSYTVGAGGAGATAGSTFPGGGNGGDGYIEVREFYQ